MFDRLNDRLKLTVKEWLGGGGLAPPSRGSGFWWPVVRESFPGAWQQNIALVDADVLSNPTVFACITLVASDVSKLTLSLVEADDEDVWRPTTNPAYTPVIRKPNRYQTTQQFIERWVISKLTFGNTFVLKVRDRRGIVTQMHVLDPYRVRPYIAPDGAVYYGVYTDDLTGLEKSDQTMVPASEIMHDRYNCLYHPLVGVSPLYAAIAPARQGLAIQDNSTGFFANQSSPGGVLYAPGAISDDTAKRLKQDWNANYGGANFGKVGVLGDGLKYEPVTMSAVDSQLTDQDMATKEAICEAFHVPKYMVGVGDPPAHAQVEPLLQLYYAQGVQAILTGLEAVLAEGLELDPTVYGVAFDIDDLIWMDTPTRTKAAGDAIGSGAMTPNEARAKYFGLGPVKGGDSCYLQQQMFSLAALAERDTTNPFPSSTAPSAAPAAQVDDTTPVPTMKDDGVDFVKFCRDLEAKVYAA